MSILFYLEDFCLCSRYNNVNYCAWHFCKPLLACSEISLLLTKEKLERSPGKGRTYDLADGMTALAQFYALYSRARFFNQWQYVLYPSFIIKHIINIFLRTLGEDTPIMRSHKKPSSPDFLRNNAFKFTRSIY